MVGEFASLLRVQVARGELGPCTPVIAVGVVGELALVGSAVVAVGSSRLGLLQKRAGMGSVIYISQ